MKRNHVLLIGILVALTFVLSACATGPSVSDSPGLSLSEDQVFVSFGNSLFRLNANNKNTEWTFPDETSNQVRFYAQPHVTDEYVYVGDVAKNFYKIDRDSGDLVWTFSQAKGYFIGQANEEGGVVYAPSNDGNLYKIDEQGDLDWVFETGHFLWSQPQIGDDAIFIGSMDKHVYAITKDDGQELWSYEMAGAVVGAPTLSEDMSALFVGSIGQDMVALDATNGEKLWTYTADESIWGQALLANGTLYFADLGGTLYFLNPANGELIKRIEVGGPVIGGLTAVPDGIALATEQGTIKVLEYDGTMKWPNEAKISGNVYQKPVVNDQYLMVVAVGEGDTVYAFNLSTGGQIWSTTPEK